MTISVGDQVADGKVIVASVDENDLVVSVVVPAASSWTGEPFHVTFTPSVTIAAIEGLVGQVTGGGGGG